MNAIKFINMLCLYYKQYKVHMYIELLYLYRDIYLRISNEIC